MNLRNAAVWLALLTAIGMSAGSAAGGNVPRTGERISFACAIIGQPCSDVTLPASEPFHVQAGHNIIGITKEELLDPDLRAELSIDGVPQHGVLDLDLVAEVPTKWDVFNFRFGMTGTHTFTVCWYGADGAQEFCGTRVVHFV